MSTTFRLALCALLLVSASTNYAASPTVLSTLDLDQVTGGFVDLQILASADAQGEGSYTDTFTDVAINEELSECGAYYITTTIGTGYAYATGELALTSLSSELSTDETVIDFSHLTNSVGSTLVENDPLMTTMQQLGGTGIADTGTQSRSHGRLNVEHLSQITVTAITRRPGTP